MLLLFLSFQFKIFMVFEIRYNDKRCKICSIFVVSRSFSV